MPMEWDDDMGWYDPAAYQAGYIPPGGSPNGVPYGSDPFGSSYNPYFDPSYGFGGYSAGSLGGGGGAAPAGGGGGSGVFSSFSSNPAFWASLASAAGGLYGASQARISANRTADSNERSVAANNAANLAMFHDARGAGGSAILPEYLRPFEGQLGESAARASQALFNYGGGPAARLNASQDYLRRYNPALEAGDGLVFDLATGKVAQDRRAALEPVLGARTALAKTRAQSINDSLDQTLAGLRADRARSGFRGTSTFDLNRMLAATTGARAGAADAVGGANLENALAVNGLSDSNLNMKLAALDQPFQRATQRLAFQNLPYQQAADQSAAAMSPLNFFRIAPGQPPAQQPFLRPDVGNGGMALGAALQAGGQQAGSYFANQQLMKELAGYFNQQRATPTAYSFPQTVRANPNTVGYSGEPRTNFTGDYWP